MKVIIRQDDYTYTVLSTDAMVIGTLEEELQQLGIRGVACHYGKVNEVAVLRDQGSDPGALDRENWLRTSIDERRPSGFSNWETFFLTECLSQDERAPQEPSQLVCYFRTGMAPRVFYELFEAEPAGDPKIIVWAEVAEALKR